MLHPKPRASSFWSRISARPRAHSDIGQSRIFPPAKPACQRGRPAKDTAERQGSQRVWERPLRWPAATERTWGAPLPLSARRPRCAVAQRTDVCESRGHHRAPFRRQACAEQSARKPRRLHRGARWCIRPGGLNHRRGRHRRNDFDHRHLGGGWNGQRRGSSGPTRNFRDQGRLNGKERELVHHLPFLLGAEELVSLRRTWNGVLPNWIIATAPIDSSSVPQDPPS